MDLPCVMIPGKGWLSSERRIGDAPNPMACAQMVRDAEPDANGAAYPSTASGGTDCYGASQSATRTPHCASVALNFVSWRSGVWNDQLEQ